MPMGTFRTCDFPGRSSGQTVPTPVNHRMAKAKQVSKHCIVSTCIAVVRSTDMEGKKIDSVFYSLALRTAKTLWSINLLEIGIGRSV